MQYARLLFLCFLCTTVFALDAPKGKVVLTVTGTVSQPNAGKDAVFTMEALTKLPQVSFTTKTPWYDSPIKFTGPLLKDVLAAAGAKGEKISLWALNDYHVEMPAADIKNYPVIVARLMNDKPMPIRDKGPLFIVYPYDSRSELNKELYFTRSIWQLSKIIIQ
ncbi:MAG: molybdopterin-dependent oxidoreductase [Proteobacteria bacterium]|nr:molybdopterin-dependent oxidoreductase [Pseudomonadota bacterium]